MQIIQRLFLYIIILPHYGRAFEKTMQILHLIDIETGLKMLHKILQTLQIHHFVINIKKNIYFINF